MSEIPSEPSVPHSVPVSDERKELISRRLYMATGVLSRDIAATGSIYRHYIRVANRLPAALSSLIRDVAIEGYPSSNPFDISEHAKAIRIGMVLGTEIGRHFEGMNKDAFHTGLKSDLTSLKYEVEDTEGEHRLMSLLTRSELSEPATNLLPPNATELVKPRGEQNQITNYLFAESYGYVYGAVVELATLSAIRLEQPTDPVIQAEIQAEAKQLAEMGDHDLAYHHFV